MKTDAMLQRDVAEETHIGTEATSPRLEQRFGLEFSGSKGSTPAPAENCAGGVQSL